MKIIKKVGSRGVLYTITTALIIASLMALMSDYSTRQADESTQLTKLMLGSKIAHIWEDIAEDIYDVTNISVEKNGTNATIYDYLPAEYDIQSFLILYSRFLVEFYETPDISIEFLDTGGGDIPLEDLPPMIMILPFNIRYHYPDYGKRELRIEVHTENFTAIERITINVSEIYPLFRYDPNFQPEKFNWAPAFQPCGMSTINCLDLRLQFSDGVRTWICHECEMGFDADHKSSLIINLGIEEANSWIQITLGKLGLEERLVMVEFLNSNMTVRTDFHLNTTEFYINHISKLRVNATTFKMYKEDWI